MTVTGRGVGLLAAAVLLLAAGFRFAYPELAVLGAAAAVAVAGRAAARRRAAPADGHPQCRPGPGRPR